MWGEHRTRELKQKAPTIAYLGLDRETGNLTRVVDLRKVVVNSFGHAMAYVSRVVNHGTVRRKLKRRQTMARYKDVKHNHANGKKPESKALARTYVSKVGVKEGA